MSAQTDHETPRLRAERLIPLGVPGKYRRDAADTSSAPAASTAVV